jgi:hypothetical protein
MRALAARRVNCANDVSLKLSLISMRPGGSVRETYV